ncbi:transcriptional regulator, GntR family [Friedmanniella luteola]|uniref:Transcriptional regulator, GntR family n=1 Tax=Friedmanniella luteola TaxID=546871 RepID=A0A1H1XKW9_9ACTN|nr:FadR/GntR family transcriptional regulator [Friedmanniella luteola]SDT09897.1 transcriptional regulator, GntR family [Friedmanniella luteola]
MSLDRPPTRRVPRGTLLPGREKRTRTSVTDDAITRIRHMILTGELAPGDKLPPESELAAELGLSRTSLREAVRALTLLGVIDTRQGDASYITSLGPELLLNALGLAMDLQREDTMADLVGVRRVLEPAATALAAARVTADDIAHLRGLIRPGLTEDRAREAVELDWEFHHEIALSSGNELLVALLDGLTAPTVRMRTWRGLTVPGALDRTLAEHEAIVDALEAGDPELARAAATVHVAGVEAWVRALPPGWSARAAEEVRLQSSPVHRTPPEPGPPTLEPR